jgi:hypothetical protein
MSNIPIVITKKLIDVIAKFMGAFPDLIIN